MANAIDEQGPGLRRNAIGLAGAVVMSAALRGPAVQVYFNSQYFNSQYFNPQYFNPHVSAASAGVATPFVFALGLVVMLIVANGVMEMARVLPSAGQFYTSVSRGIGPRSGFVTGY